MVALQRPASAEAPPPWSDLQPLLVYLQRNATLCKVIYQELQGPLPRQHANTHLRVSVGTRPWRPHKAHVRRARWCEDEDLSSHGPAEKVERTLTSSDGCSSRGPLPFTHAKHTHTHMNAPQALFNRACCLHCVSSIYGNSLISRFHVCYVCYRCVNEVNRSVPKSPADGGRPCLDGVCKRASAALLGYSNTHFLCEGGSKETDKRSVKREQAEVYM